MSGSHANVLVVEDDLQVRALISRVLSREGHHVIEADNAWQALFHLQRSVDLAVLDLRLPFDIDGHMLMGTLQDWGKDVPVIVVSGWASEYVTGSASEYSEWPSMVRAVFDKPLCVEEFVAKVADVLGCPSGR